ncbi:unnamed protein product [Chrysoparadoxa australica]
MARQRVVHFDIKCANVLVRDALGAPESAEAKCPQVCLCDFGEALIGEESTQEPGHIAVVVSRARGTEGVQSPEMLLISNKIRGCSGEDRKLITSATDVWSCGCLLYELLTGRTLFNTASFSEFFVTVTQGSEPLPAEQSLKAAELRSLDAAGVLPQITQIMGLALTRDPSKRRLADVIEAVTEMKHACARALPQPIGLEPGAAC